jgi:hypothetical protein
LYDFVRHLKTILLTLLLPGSVFAGSAQILYFEPLQPEVATSGAAQKQSNQHALGFQAFGRRFDLTLSRNENIVQQNKNSASAEGPALRLYKGDVNGTPGSWARMAAQGERLHGMIWDGRELYIIEPADALSDSLSPSLAAPNSGSIVFRLSDTRMQTAATCGARTHPGATGLAHYKTLVSELQAVSGAAQGTSATKRIELSAMGDAFYRQHYGSDQSAEDQILLRLNNVDGIFSSQIGVAVQVPTVLVEAANGTAFSTTLAANTLLEELGVVRKNSSQLRSRGLTHLFTGRDLDGDTVGVAYIDTLCESQTGVGLTQATGSSTVWIDSLVAAHEIGHNFGAYHDGENPPGVSPNECHDTANHQYLMAAQVDADHSQFSQCSRTVIRNTAGAAPCVTPISTADVAISEDLGQVRAIAGSEFDWSFDVTNVGSANATSTEARALLPPSLTIVEAWVTGGTCTAGAGLIDCDLGSLSGGVTRTVYTRLRSDGVASNSASVVLSAANDAGMNNNHGDGLIDIEHNVDLAIELSTPASSAVGQRVTGSFTLRNLSQAAAHAPNVLFTIPAGFAVAGATWSGGDCTPVTGGMRCTLTELGGGASVSGSLELDASASGTYALTALASSDDLDGNTSNNAASGSLQVMSSGAASSNSSKSGGGGALGMELWLLALAGCGTRRLRQRIR